MIHLYMQNLVKFSGLLNLGFLQNNLELNWAVQMATHFRNKLFPAEVDCE